MARCLSLPLSRFPFLTLTSSSRIFPLRSFSNPPTYTTDTDDQSSTDTLVRFLEDAIHKIIVRRSAPDWLPFLPGSSYWVPPPPSSGGSLPLFAPLLEKLANPSPSSKVSLSSSSSSAFSSRGWPSFDYFIHGAPFHQMEVEVPSEDVEVEASSSDISKSQEGEG